MNDTGPTVTTEAQPLFAKVCAFCFPGGEEAARRVLAIRTTQRGEMRMSPQAKWIPFTSEEVTHATRSNFRWDARIKTGAFTSLTATDAFEEGRGRLVVKVAGAIPVNKLEGPDLDKGELQRYLSSIAFCPPILLNHASLEIASDGPLTLRLRNRQDSTEAILDIDVSGEGQPLTCRADRPRMLGKKALLTPWSGIVAGYQEWNGLRVATRLEVSWHLPEGQFTYYRGEILSFSLVS